MARGVPIKRESKALDRVGVLVLRTLQLGSRNQRVSLAFLNRGLPVLLGFYVVGCAVSQSLMSLMATILCLFAFVDLALRFKQKRLLHAIAFGALALFFVIAVSNLVTRSINGLPVEWKALEVLPLYTLAFWPLAWSAEERHALTFGNRRLCLWLGVGVVAYAVSALFACYEGIVAGRMAVAWMKNPIYLAYNLLFALVLAGSLLGRLPSRFRVWTASLCALLLLGIFYTNSRMALLVALLMSLVLVGRWAWANLPKALLLVVCAFGMGAGVWEYTSKSYVRERVASALNFEDPSWQGRRLAWSHNITIISKNPVFGVGPKQNGLYTRDLDAKWQQLWGANVLIFAHSIYFQLLAEVGILGFVLMLFAFVILYRARPATRPLIVALLLGGITENIFSNSKSMHALLMALMIAGFWHDDTP